MRELIGPWMLVLVVACGGGPGTQAGGNSGGSEAGSEGGSSAGTDAGTMMEGGETGEGDETAGEASGGEAGDDDSDGGGDDEGGSDAHECTAFDPALDEPPCDGGGDAESEPNDEVSQANAVCVDRDYVAAISNDTDIDVFEFETPPAAYGGYVVVSLTDVDAQATMDLEVRAGVDNSVIISDGTVYEGESLYVWFTAAPGQVYRAISSHGYNEVGGYSFLAQWFPAPDCYEPNDTRADAKSIPVGETIEAFLLAGHIADDIVNEQFDDWYRVHLQAGTVEVTLRDVPAQASMEVELLDAQGAAVASEYGFEGEGLTLMTDVPAGDYHVRVSRNYTAATEGMGPETIPEHLMHPYSLTVTRDRSKNPVLPTWAAL